jgi:hypothetical protein
VRLGWIEQQHSAATLNVHSRLLQKLENHAARHVAYYNFRLADCHTEIRQANSATRL